MSSADPHAEILTFYPPPENGGCPPNCGHTQAEHVAFDLGVEQGTKLGYGAENPYDYKRLPDDYEAWETGFSVGQMNYDAERREMRARRQKLLNLSLCKARWYDRSLRIIDRYLFGREVSPAREAKARGALAKIEAAITRLDQRVARIESGASTEVR